jgi:FkbM family methyltransferase
MNSDKAYKIGPFELILPHDHMLDRYQQNYPLYDWVLGELIPLLLAKYPDAAAIDIGANVGDTAAGMCRKQTIPVLCIEGHPQFISYLRRNLERLPGCIEVDECLVGAVAGSVSAARLATQGGTASIDIRAGDDGKGVRIPIRPLVEILRDHPRFQRARLLKIDTDGSDFEILMSSLDAIRDTHPVLFFEYAPTLRTDGAKFARETISMLLQAGYRSFLLYDNFGHFMGRIDENCREKFIALDHYLFSNLYFGTQIYYYDVCAFGPDDGDLRRGLENAHRFQVEAALSRDGRDI